MHTPRILTLVGGISQGSINKKLFQVVQELAGDEVEFMLPQIAKLPFFSQDLENDPPDLVTAYKDQIRHADAVLFVTPEYNRSLPGVLKNAIDWGSRPYGQNLWERMPAGIMGASVGNIGTFGAQHHLRQILSYLNMLVMNQPEFYLNFSKGFDENGKLSNQHTREFIQHYWNSFLEWVQRYGLSSGAGHFKSQGLEDSPTAPH